MNCLTAVLFWCYKEPSLCRDRLEWLRMYNPDAPVFVLFGGESGHADAFRRELAGLYQDFWVHPGKPPEASLPHAIHCPDGGVDWKWYYGDLMLRDWFRDRGRNLPWDRIFIMQWDMLVLDSLDRLLKRLKPEEALFSGLRPVAEVEEKWTWTSPANPDFRTDYEAFTRHVVECHNHRTPPLCCVAVVMVLPKVFFDHFATIPQPALGFLEYKLPTYAEAFGIPVNRSIRFSVWWDDHEPYRWHRAIHAVPINIKPLVIALGFCLPGRPRVFHPYSRILPRSFNQWLHLLAGSMRRDLHGILRDVFRRGGRGLQPPTGNKS